jgi:hypothetical protein
VILDYAVVGVGTTIPEGWLIVVVGVMLDCTVVGVMLGYAVVGVMLD